MLNELVRWNPFEEELSSWHRDIDDLFGRFFGRPELRLTGGRPPMETYRKDGNYVVRFDLPGVDPKDLDVHVEGRAWWCCRWGRRSRFRSTARQSTKAEA